MWGFTAGLLDRLLALGGWERPWDAGRVRTLDPEAAALAARGATFPAGLPVEGPAAEPCRDLGSRDAG